MLFRSMGSTAVGGSGMHSTAVCCSGMGSTAVGGSGMHSMAVGGSGMHSTAVGGCSVVDGVWDLFWHDRTIVRCRRVVAEHNHWSKAKYPRLRCHRGLSVDISESGIDFL